jgi:hypothetical protein
VVQEVPAAQSVQSGLEAAPSEAASFSEDASLLCATEERASAEEGFAPDEAASEDTAPCPDDCACLQYALHATSSGE